MRKPAGHHQARRVNSVGENDREETRPKNAKSPPASLRAGFGWLLRHEAQPTINAAMMCAIAQAVKR